MAKKNSQEITSFEVVDFEGKPITKSNIHIDDKGLDLLAAIAMKVMYGMEYKK